MKGAVMVCGTSSDAGKSLVVTGLCRLLARRGVKVAPFKAQNMSLNSFVTPAGHEIGRAQGAQALAAGVEPEVAMNPVLLKPTGQRSSQVVVNGAPIGHLSAADYHALRPRLMDTVLAALEDLRTRFDVVVAEGAGSPAEINLLEGDIVNLSLAHRAGMPAVLVGDIERGGVFASLYGTVALLPEHLRAHVRAFVINKFRGDPALLGDGPSELARRSGVPTIGVLPWLDGAVIDAEDSLALRAFGRHRSGPPVADALQVVAVRLPRISNFTDLDAMAVEPGVAARLAEDPAQLAGADLIVVPGSKSTVADLEWLRASGFEAALATRRAEGATILGICGGYQMLGRSIADPEGVESSSPRTDGLGWLAVDTVYEPDKTVRQRRGRAMGEAVTGYEIHHGRPLTDTIGWVELDDSYGSERDGAVSEDGAVAGTILHGLFEQDGLRARFLEAVAARRGRRFVPAGVSFAAARASQYDRIADLLEAHLDLDALSGLIAEGAR
ncbi:MAG TPA: cobyric acid synthase [Acidimicrobiales bacterium]|nr:cobyric acid synthase [Acidimicrobiales bacterium]